MKLPVYQLKKCTKCNRKKHVTYFQSYSKHKKKKYVKQCYQCRLKNTDRIKNTNTCTKTNLVNKCRQQWIEWKQTHSCVHCGESDSEVLQADHFRGKKIREVSFYTYWACNGGPAAQREEFKKVQCLCRYCHDVITKRDYFKKKTQRNVSNQSDEHKTQKNNYVNKEKFRRQGCALCDRKVTKETVNCFKFDHGENFAKKNFGISNYISKNNCSFQKAKPKLKLEMMLCRLLCSNCDWKETRKDLWGHKMPVPWQKEQDEYWDF